MAGKIYGLNILAEDIQVCLSASLCGDIFLSVLDMLHHPHFLLQDDCDNVTRFLMLAREPIIPGTDRPFKVFPFIILSTENYNLNINIVLLHSFINECGS